jgi:serine/threonine protein kinase
MKQRLNKFAIDDVRRKDNLSNEDKVFAIKVIERTKLDKKDLNERMQMVNEIQIQRALRYCGNVIKLYKIYESDKYLNLLLEYQEGGCLGDMLEK